LALLVVGLWLEVGHTPEEGHGGDAESYCAYCLVLRNQTAAVPSFGVRLVEPAVVEWFDAAPVSWYAVDRPEGRAPDARAPPAHAF
jgi:hypothetical protein